MRRIPILTLMTAALLVGVLVLYAITYRVRFSEAAVKVRFGQASESSVVRDPGLYWKWPAPVEFVKTFDLRLRVLDTPDTEVKTLDGQNVLVSVFALWRIADPLLFYQRVENERRAEDLMRNRVGEARTTALGQHEMVDLANLDAERVEKKYEELQARMLTLSRAAVRSDYGIDLVDIRVRRISLPPETTNAVQQAMTQEREAKATGYREEGKAAAVTIREGAMAKAASIRAFAESEARRIEIAGEEAGARYLAQIPEEDAEFFLWLRWLEALEAAFKNKATIFLDSRQDIMQRFMQPLAPKQAPAGGETNAP